MPAYYPGLEGQPLLECGLIYLLCTIQVGRVFVENTIAFVFVCCRFTNVMHLCYVLSYTEGIFIEEATIGIKIMLSK